MEDEFAFDFGDAAPVPLTASGYSSPTIALLPDDPFALYMGGTGIDPVTGAVTGLSVQVPNLQLEESALPPLVHLLDTATRDLPRSVIPRLAQINAAAGVAAAAAGLPGATGTPLPRARRDEPQQQQHHDVARFYRSPFVADIDTAAESKTSGTRSTKRASPRLIKPIPGRPSADAAAPSQSAAPVAGTHPPDSAIGAPPPKNAAIGMGSPSGSLWLTESTATGMRSPQTSGGSSGPDAPAAATGAVVATSAAPKVSAEASAAPPRDAVPMATLLRDLNRRTLRMAARQHARAMLPRPLPGGGAPPAPAVDASAPAPEAAAVATAAATPSSPSMMVRVQSGTGRRLDGGMGSPISSAEIGLALGLEVSPAEPRRWQPKERRRVVWTAEMRQRFYEGLRRFGLNMDHIARMFPTLTREDIVRRYKAEREGHHREITEALAPEQRIATDPEELRAWAHEWERQRTMAPQQDIADDDALALAQNAADAEARAHVKEEKHSGAGDSDTDSVGVFAKQAEPAPRTVSSFLDAAPPRRRLQYASITPSAGTRRARSEGHPTDNSDGSASSELRAAANPAPGSRGRGPRTGKSVTPPMRPARNRLATEDAAAAALASRPSGVKAVGAASQAVEDDFDFTLDDAPVAAARHRAPTAVPTAPHTPPLTARHTFQDVTPRAESLGHHMESLAFADFAVAAAADADDFNF